MCSQGRSEGDTCPDREVFSFANELGVLFLMVYPLPSEKNQLVRLATEVLFLVILTTKGMKQKERKQQTCIIHAFSHPSSP